MIDEKDAHPTRQDRVSNQSQIPNIRQLYKNAVCKDSYKRIIKHLLERSVINDGELH